MSLFNCHTHTMYSHDGKGSIEALCRSAIKNKLSGFAVTDHCDCEYADDVTMLKNLGVSYSEAAKHKELYKDRLIISKGIEIGEAIFNPAFAARIISENCYDVILGSIHAVRIEGWEMPFSVIDFSDKDVEFIDKYVTQYFLDLLETARKTDYDILCHLTVVLRYIVHKYKKSVDIGKNFPVIEEILKTVISRDKTLELNTSGFSDGYFMPDKDIVLMYKSLGGKMIALGSDAHIPENISIGLDAAKNMLRDIGFTTLIYYDNRKPTEYKI